jgi:hypothetical protein
VQGQTLKALRVHLGIKGKGRPIPKTLPLPIQADGKEAKIDMPIDDYPIIFNMLCFGPPTLFARDSVGGLLVTGMTLVRMKHDERMLHKKYGITSFFTGRWDNQSFCRMLAKIGHSFAVAELGLDGFKPLLPELIRKGGLEVGPYIGGEPRQPPESAALHEISLGRQRAHGKTYIVARIRLLACHGGPIYYAVVGEALSSRIAILRSTFWCKVSSMLAR